MNDFSEKLRFGIAFAANGIFAFLTAVDIRGINVLTITPDTADQQRLLAQQICEDEGRPTDRTVEH